MKLPLAELATVPVTVSIPSTINNEDLEKAIRTLFELADEYKEGSLCKIGLRSFLYFLMAT